VGQILSIVSQKGGVGKTTTAVNLGAAFARRGLKTLIVDVDPQGSVRYGAALKKGHGTHGFADYLDGTRPLKDVILPTALPWLRVMLVGTVSDDADHSDYARRIAEGDLLPKMLDAARERCDIVVVDTPPGLGPITRRALESSDRVLVPLQCEPLVLQTTPQILRGIQDVVTRHPHLTLDGILLTMYEAGNAACERTEQYLRGHLSKRMVFDLVIPRSAAVSEAFAAGQPAVLRAPSDPGSQAYIHLASLLAERFKK
jgi:chromosome partitioning protein